MKIEIFIVESEQVLVDRTYLIDEDGNAPKIDIQDLLDDARSYLKEEEKKNHTAEFANKVDLSPDDPAFRKNPSNNKTNEPI